MKGGEKLKVVEQIFISGKMPVGSDIAVAVQEAIQTYGMQAAKEISNKYKVSVRPIVENVCSIGIETENNHITRQITQMYVLLIIVNMVESEISINLN